MASHNDGFMHELLATFRAEAKEHLLRIVAVMVLLERAKPDAYGPHCENVLKELHALKGAARTVNLNALENLCHGMESFFSTLRKSDKVFTPEQYDVAHQACQVAEQLLTDSSGRIRNRTTALTRQLVQISDQMLSGVPAKREVSPSVTEEASPDTGTYQAIERTPNDRQDLQGDKGEIIRVRSQNLDEIRYYVESLLTVDLQFQRYIADLKTLAQHTDMLSLPLQSATDHERERKTARSSTGETRAARQGMLHESQEKSFALRCQQIADSLSRTSRHLATVRSRLLDAAMETSLAPLSTVLAPLPGLARNLARQQSKEVVLKYDVGHIQVDRRVLEVLHDVLVHLVTNAVDHGIEPLSARIQQGKNGFGEILIEAQPDESGQITLSLSDDGAGIDISQLMNAARRSGVLDEESIGNLSEREALRLALRSGISTREEVSQSSGRGLGLAIVAEKIASVGGCLEIASTPGKGCAFHLSLPVSLATIRGLVLRVSNHHLVLPLYEVDKVIKPNKDDIQCVENRETLVESGQVLPAIRLHALLNIETLSDSAQEPTAVIVHRQSSAAALLVDEVVEEREVLPKGLGKQIRRMRFITGAAQLDDRSLVPILGLRDILHYGMFTGDESRSHNLHSAAVSATDRRLLVVEDSITSRLLLKHILENTGYQVETASDGLEALSMLRNKHFDAVVSDVEMPNLDGLELVSRLRADPKTAEMPVILVTSLGSDEEKQRGLQAGADAYVIKGSFDQDNLVATIQRFI